MSVQKNWKGSWVGVDLDGTLAEHMNDWKGPSHIGPPIPKMVNRVKDWIDNKKEVRLLTARVASTVPKGERDEFKVAWKEWSMKHLGVVLKTTAEKDPGMVELWDDRAIQVIRNTGERK